MFVGVNGGGNVGFVGGKIYYVEYYWLFVVVIVLFFVWDFGGCGD